LFSDGTFSYVPPKRRELLADYNAAKSQKKQYSSQSLPSEPNWLLGLLYNPEDGGTMYLRNVGKFLQHFSHIAEDSTRELKL
jgi:hypothetical protein